MLRESPLCCAHGRVKHPLQRFTFLLVKNSFSRAEVVLLEKFSCRIVIPPRSYRGIRIYEPFAFQRSVRPVFFTIRKPGTADFNIFCVRIEFIVVQRGVAVPARSDAPDGIERCFFRHLRKRTRVRITEEDNDEKKTEKAAAHITI